VSWGPGGIGRAARVRCCKETERGKQEEEDEDLFVKFAKVKFSSKLWL
jgi:hypothetical protein